MSELKLLNQKELFELIEKVKDVGFIRLAGKDPSYTVDIENNNSLILHGDGEATEVYNDRAILLNKYKLLLQEVDSLSWLEFSFFVPLDLTI